MNKENCGCNGCQMAASCKCNRNELASDRSYFRILNQPVMHVGGGTLSPNAILGNGNEVQAPTCNPNGIEVPANCTDSNHSNAGNCYEGLKCSNYTGSWCWTSGLGCSGTTGGVNNIVPPIF